MVDLNKLAEQYYHGRIGDTPGFAWELPPSTRWQRVRAWVWHLTHRRRPPSTGNWCGTLDLPANQPPEAPRAGE